MTGRRTTTARALGATTAAALLLLTSCTSGDDGPGAAEAPDDSPSAPSSTPADDGSDNGSDDGSDAGQDDELLDYSDQNQGNGVELEDPADVDQLTGAPDDFVDFITGVLAKADEQCPDGGVVTVGGIALGDHPTALGGVGGCGGYVALWAVVDGEWKEVEGTQEAFDCALLEKYQPPAALVGHVCFDYDGDQRRHRYPRAS